MGIIKATADAVGGSLSSQWLDYIVSDKMDNHVLMTRGVRVLKSKTGTSYSPVQTISNGSKIRVAPNQFMILCDGGQIVDCCETEGYYEVWLSSSPSVFNGELRATFKETFQRIKYGGQSPASQEVYFINLQEIKGLKFGTRNPLQYFDSFYQTELFIRCHGTYSIRITEPMKFFEEVVPRNADFVSTQVLSDQCLEEFLMALQGAFSSLSMEGVRTSDLGAKNADIAHDLKQQLDPIWKEQRGFELISVGIGNISYDDQSREWINMHNRKSLFPSGDSSPSPSKINLRKGWICSCGTENYGKFCSNCGMKNPRAVSRWICSCGQSNTGKFCISCGRKKLNG